MESERASEPTCTCPSGDGSLRWSCPVHPSRSAADVMYEMAVAELTAAASAGTTEHGDRAVTPGMYFGPQRATRLRAAIAHVQAMQAARTDVLVFDYKVVAENAVLAFSRVAAALGCSAGGGADAVLAAIAKLRTPAAPAGHVAIVCDFRRSTPFPEFIEAEIDGRSVSLQWRDRADGTHELLVPVTAAPASDEQYADAEALIAHLSELVDDGGHGGEPWPPAQAAIAGIRAWQAGTPAAPGIDPTDPWRGLYNPARMPKLDGVGDYVAAHPDLPEWPEDDERSIAPLIRAQGFEWDAVSGDYGTDYMSVDEFDTCAWLAAWKPEPPAGEGWRLVLVHDTEDGPVAVFVRPLALIDASSKGGSGSLRPALVDAAALRRALAEYPGRNTHQLQARKVCAGVLALAESYGAEARNSPKNGSDTARLDSGMIRLSHRDEFGEDGYILHTGVNLRAAIDAAMQYQADDAEVRNG